MDYMLRDELAIKNAIPTAEGAIEIAISETPITLHNSKCLVLGYGKVGKILAKSLDALGAKTYVSARKYADLALVEGHGYIPLSVSESKLRLDEFDIIFNTVPALILGEAELRKTRRDSLIIDLASKPGGVDFEAAKELGLHVVWALSLPGRVAPVTAGIIIKDTITNMLREEV
jgi:dipicolinate synthase subunit A